MRRHVLDSCKRWDCRPLVSYRLVSYRLVPCLLLCLRSPRHLSAPVSVPLAPPPLRNMTVQTYPYRDASAPSSSSLASSLLALSSLGSRAPGQEAPSPSSSSAP